MRRLHRWLTWAAASALSGCVADAAPPAGPVTPAASTTAQAEAALPPIVFVEDDIAAAAARAKAEGKALFVDVWAPWCHTCLSMKNYVLGEPALRPLASRVVFAAIDGDRPTSAGFLERHAVSVWPTFFVIDPAKDTVAGAWFGSASLAELRGFIEDSLTTIEASRAGTLAPDDPVRLLAEARAAHAAREPAKAAALFERAAGKLPADHPRRSEVLSGWLFALYAGGDHKGCADVGERHLGEVRGAAVPADFSSILLSCAARLPAEEKARVRAAAIGRLRALTASPSPEASPDDRADAWGILAEALEDAGDAEGAKRALEAKLAILEKAAAGAPAPEVAATYDYARAATYVALGKGGLAIAMLEAREKEMPGSYEPPARLASTLFKLARHEEAKAAIDRAIAKAYGPRKLGYIKLRGAILARLGDAAGALEALREEVRGWEALPPGQASPKALEDARRRLAAAEAAAPK